MGKNRILQLRIFSLSSLKFEAIYNFEAVRERTLYTFNGIMYVHLYNMAIWQPPFKFSIKIRHTFIRKTRVAVK